MTAAAVGAGLLRREADQADGRRSRLVPTADGEARTAAVRAGRQARFDAAMAGWSDAERATFADLLTRFVVGLDT